MVSTNVHVLTRALEKVRPWSTDVGNGSNADCRLMAALGRKQTGVKVSFGSKADVASTKQVFCVSLEDSAPGVSYGASQLIYLS